jgi:hypothetical protein
MEKRNIIDVMYHVAEIRELARQYGLVAEYIPVVGAIEIMSDGIPLGISFDGVRIKDNSNNCIYSLRRWMKAFYATSFLSK